VGGTVAACTPTSSTVVCVTNILSSAVQQWEQGTEKNQFHSLPQLPALTSSLLSLVPKKAANTILHWEG